MLKTFEVKQGRPATVYHFPVNLGQPVSSQDVSDDLYFLKLTNRNIEITKVSRLSDGTPVAQKTAVTAHGWKDFRWPSPASQKGTDKTVASVVGTPRRLFCKGALSGLLIRSM